ncbi:GntR family transcriptional regulator [Labrys monachus]|uniref:DNA-binding GntR family transcriptional regulator n=1 Tax=Labrys monachus TaxID=217067 RepID=A0ABU0FBZ3_9HYPH|nr:GntR family transcriptional regulator [Labrys monachus]MDQ0392061.1 DNA-binding GntR family transcriptional regulator [Labrys monachus]
MPVQTILSSDDSGFLPVSSATFADQVADQIVDAIAARRLVSGERLIETELAAALHVSRVPVREAIRILTSQGIVVATPRRGARVATFDAPWARQLHDARVAIERLGAHLAADIVKSDPAALARLEVCVTAIEQARGNWLSVNRADIAFHAAVFEIAGSPLMITLWNAISRHVLIMFSIETYRDVDFDRVVKEHRDYIDALLHKTPEGIDKEIDLHVAGLKTFDL